MRRGPCWFQSEGGPLTHAAGASVALPNTMHTIVRQEWVPGWRGCLQSEAGSGQIPGHNSVRGLTAHWASGQTL